MRGLRYFELERLCGLSWRGCGSPAAPRERITISNIWRTPPKRERRHDPERRGIGTAIMVAAMALGVALLGILRLLVG